MRRLYTRIKQALVDASEGDTRLMFRTMNNITRVLRNVISEEVLVTERQPGGCKFEDIRHLVAGSRGRDALCSGEVDGGVVATGQVVGQDKCRDECRDSARDKQN
jgi:NAD(P)H-dependent flavin oxidoreductase YrpB (nitropropane dioxygenase family)